MKDESSLNLERAKELLALRLYDELTPAEGEALARFLATNAEARAFADELAAGLGAVQAAEGQATPALPADWDERLRAATRARPPRLTLARTLGTFAAGLAAGLLLTWAGAPDPGTPPPDGPPGAAILADVGPDFLPRPGPPPRATGGGALSRR